MADAEALPPIEEKILEFYDDTRIAAQLEEGSIYVPIRTRCENLGLSWAGQRESIQLKIRQIPSQTRGLSQ